MPVDDLYLKKLLEKCAKTFKEDREMAKSDARYCQVNKIKQEPFIRKYQVKITNLQIIWQTSSSRSVQWPVYQLGKGQNT